MMDSTARERLWSVGQAFDQPVVPWLMAGLGVVLLLVPLVFVMLAALGKADEKLRKELWDRYKSWLIFIPLMFGPVLLGAAWVIAAVGLLGVLGYREFARVAGLLGERIIGICVVLGILALAFAAMDHWYDLFMGLMPVTIAVIAVAALLSDRPKGYIRRVALGMVAFILFGACLGHLGYFANDRLFRPMLLWLISAVELNDIFAYIAGKTVGGRKLAPNTSPGKTLGGGLGALFLTTIYAAALGHWVFKGTSLDRPAHLILLGVTMSAAGQIGDLTLSAMKRDLGIKDWANTFPGHGGLLDRFNSLLFAAPAVFHYVRCAKGIGLDEPQRMMTGG